MRATKKQIAVITILNIIIAGLIALIFLWRPFAKPDGETAAPGTSDEAGGTDDVNGDNSTAVTPHNKLRDAEPGLVKEISRCTQLMGSGDESIIFSHTAAGVTYIFGNAIVGDYDFDTSGGFLCRLDDSGKILGFSYFSGKLTAAALIEGGFGAATVVDRGEATEKCTLYSVTDDGDISELAQLDGAAVDILSNGSKKMAVITAPGAGTLKLVEFTRAGNGWAVGGSTRMSNGLSIDYFACYIKGDEYILAARAYSDTRYDSILFYTLAAGSDATLHYFEGSVNQMFTPYAVMPYADGYLAVGKYGSKGALYTVDKTFSKRSIDELGVACDSASLIYSGGKYYVSFMGSGSAVTYEVDSLLNRKTLSELDGLVPRAAVVTDGKVVFACTTDSSMVVTDLADVKITLNITSPSIAKASLVGFNEVLLLITARGGAAIKTPIGGADVYALDIRL